MSHRVLLSSGLVAVAAALIWAAITYFTGFEIGYVAWLVGLMIGGAAVAVGGKGTTCGAVCAAFALASIFLGKVLAVEFSVRGEVAKHLEAQLTREGYDEAIKDAADFVQLQSPEDYPAFMVTHGFTEAKTPEAIPQEDLSGFKNDQVPRLRRLHEQKPDYETWRKQSLDEIAEVVGSDLSISKMVIADLGPIDLIFGILGIATAYRVPARRES